MKPQEYEIMEIEEQHIHNPFYSGEKKNIFSALFNARLLIERSSGTAECKYCGKLIRYPEVVFTYMKIISWLYVPLMVVSALCTIPSIGPIYNTDIPWVKLTLFFIFLLALSFLLFFVIPVVIMLYRPWLIVSVGVHGERKALALERENIRSQRKANGLYVCISYILSMLIFVS